MNLNDSTVLVMNKCFLPYRPSPTGRSPDLLPSEYAPCHLPGTWTPGSAAYVFRRSCLPFNINTTMYVISQP